MSERDSREKNKWLFRGAVLAAIVAVIIYVVATKNRSAGEELSDAGASTQAPVGTPASLLFDAYVTTPNTSWKKLQRGVGGAVGILPATLPGVVVSMTDLDPQLAGELDGTAPMFGAAAGDPTNPGFAFAMKVTDPRRARMLLLDGETARYAAKESNAGMTFLVPKVHPDDQKLAVALAANGYLLVGRSREDVETLGPYVSRTLPTRKLATDSAAVIEVPKSALGTVLKPRLERAWEDAKAFLRVEDDRMRKERGGRAPDFGDPAAIVATIDPIITRRIAVVGDLTELKIAIDVTDDAAFVTTTMTGGGAAKEWVDGMAVGDTAPLLSLPATSAFALVTRDAESHRSAQADEIEKGMTTSLGGRVKDEDKKRIHDVLADVTKARGDTVAIAVSLDEPTGSLLRAPVRDEAAAQKAIRGALELAQVDPFKDLLRIKTIATSNEDLKDIGKASLATITRETKKKDGRDAGAPRHTNAGDGGAAKGEPTAGVAWFVEGGKELTVAAGAEPTVTLHLGVKTEKKLESEPTMTRFAANVGQTASTLVVAQPLRADPKRANLPTAPLAIAVGKKGAEAYVRIEIADGLLREAARWQMGF